jgi:hypothetical protein
MKLNTLRYISTIETEKTKISLDDDGIFLQSSNTAKVMVRSLLIKDWNQLIRFPLS